MSPIGSDGPVHGSRAYLPRLQTIHWTLADMRILVLIVRNDQRLFWRKLNPTGGGFLRTLIACAVGFCLMQFLALVIMVNLPSLPTLEAMGWGWAALGLIMFSTGLYRAPDLIHDQQDFRLLVSTPVGMGTLLAARLVSLVASCLLASLFLAAPAFNALVIAFGPTHLVGYPIWLLLGIVSSAVSVVLTSMATRGVGFRASRILLQSCSAILVFLPIAVVSLHASFPEWPWQSLLKGLASSLSASLPVMAAAGHSFDFLLLACIALLAAGIAIVLIGTGYREILQLSLDRACNRPNVRPRWHGGAFSSLAAKELRGILRHESLWGGLCYQLVSGLVLGPAIYAGWGAKALLPLLLYLACSSSFEFAVCAWDSETAWPLVTQTSRSIKAVLATKLFASVLIPVASVTVCAMAAFFFVPRPACLLTVAGALVGGLFSAWLVLRRADFPTTVCLIEPSPAHSLLARLLMGLFALACVIPASLAVAGHEWIGVLTLLPPALVCAIALVHLWTFAE